MISKKQVAVCDLIYAIQVKLEDPFSTHAENGTSHFSSEVATGKEGRTYERFHNTPHKFFLVFYWERVLAGLFHPLVVELFEIYHLFHPVKNE
jgi:hypothetical protein